MVSGAFSEFPFLVLGTQGISRVQHQEKVASWISGFDDIFDTENREEVLRKHRSNSVVSHEMQRGR